MTPRLMTHPLHPHPLFAPSTPAAGDRQQQGQMVWVMFPPLLFSLPSPCAGATGSCYGSEEMLSLFVSIHWRYKQRPQSFGL